MKIACRPIHGLYSTGISNLCYVYPLFSYYLPDFPTALLNCKKKIAFVTILGSDEERSQIVCEGEREREHRERERERERARERERERERD